MQIRTSLLATTALVALTLAAPAANAAGSGWYVSLSGGGNWTDDNSFLVTANTSSTTFALATDTDTGWVVTGAVGYSLTGLMPGLRVEVEAGYRDNQVDGAFLTFTSGGNTSDSGLVDADLQTFSVLANAWYDFDVGGFKPYIGGGIGWAETEFEGTYLGGVATTPFAFEDSGFAWQVGGGINFDISPNVKLGIGYRYFSAPEVTVLPPNTAAPVLLTGDIENDNHSATLSVTFAM
jgi:opacity protein-like surface antigen